MILTLDPSSTCIGWATFTGYERLYQFGRLSPDRSKMRTNERIVNLCAQLFGLIDRLEPEAIVMEDCSPQSGRGARAGKGAGLPVYGKAVGYFWAALDRKGCGWTDFDLELIEVQTWTNRQIGNRRVAQSKEQRQAYVKYLHKDYDPTADPGGDAADAIALGEWWLTERKLQKAAQ